MLSPPHLCCTGISKQFLLPAAAAPAAVAALIKRLLSYFREDEERLFSRRCSWLNCYSSSLWLAENTGKSFAQSVDLSSGLSCCCCREPNQNLEMRITCYPAIVVDAAIASSLSCPLIPQFLEAAAAVKLRDLAVGFLQIWRKRRGGPSSTSDRIYVIFSPLPTNLVLHGQEVFS
jgi:hypothetical protein